MSHWRYCIFVPVNLIRLSCSKTGTRLLGSLTSLGLTLYIQVFDKLSLYFSANPTLPNNFLTFEDISPMEISLISLTILWLLTIFSSGPCCQGVCTVARFSARFSAARPSAARSSTAQCCHSVLLVEVVQKSLPSHQAFLHHQDLYIYPPMLIPVLIFIGSLN